MANFNSHRQPPLQFSLNPLPIVTTRRIYIQNVTNILHVALVRQEYKRAYRAWSVLIRCPEYDHTLSWSWGLPLLGWTERAGEGGELEIVDEGEAVKAEKTETYLRRTLTMVKNADKSNVLQALILHEIRNEQYHQALEDLDLYLSSYPYLTSTSLHIYAGLLCFFLSIPINNRSQKVPPSYFNLDTSAGNLSSPASPFSPFQQFQNNGFNLNIPARAGEPSKLQTRSAPSSPAPSFAQSFSQTPGPRARDESPSYRGSSPRQPSSASKSERSSPTPTPTPRARRIPQQQPIQEVYKQMDRMFLERSLKMFSKAIDIDQDRIIKLGLSVAGGGKPKKGPKIKRWRSSRTEVGGVWEGVGEGEESDSGDSDDVGEGEGGDEESVDELRAQAQRNDSGATAIAKAYIKDIQSILSVNSLGAEQYEEDGSESYSHQSGSGYNGNRSEDGSGYDRSRSRSQGYRAGSEFIDGQDDQDMDISGDGESRADEEEDDSDPEFDEYGKRLRPARSLVTTGVSGYASGAGRMDVDEDGKSDGEDGRSEYSDLSVG